MEAPPTKRPDHVRTATRRDESRLYDFLVELHKENAIYAMTPDKVWKQIRKATEREGGLIGIIEQDGRIAGCVGLFLNQYWYTENFHLSEYWSYVHPDYRRSSYAQDLIDFSKWANENMNIALHMGIQSFTRMEGKVRLYKRKLMLIGAFFMNPPRTRKEQAHG